MTVPSPLAVGTVSHDVIEAVFQYSSLRRRPITLIATPNQVSFDSGYVATLSELNILCETFYRRAPHAQVFFARDHLLLDDNDMLDLSRIAEEVERLYESGFRLIHFDAAKLDIDNDGTRRLLAQAIDAARSCFPDLLFEVSLTPDDKLRFAHILDEHLDGLTYLRPHFVVLPTGSRVRNARQLGGFDRETLRPIAARAHSMGFLLKEHNADFLAAEDVRSRLDIVDAFNIAPECGVAQTRLTLHLAKKLGISSTDFIAEVLESGSWRKWVSGSASQDRRLWTGGQYHFSSPRYRHIIDEIGRRVDFQELLSNALFEIFDRYYAAAPPTSRFKS